MLTNNLNKTWKYFRSYLVVFCDNITYLFVEIIDDSFMTPIIKVHILFYFSFFLNKSKYIYLKLYYPQYSWKKKTVWFYVWIILKKKQKQILAI